MGKAFGKIKADAIHLVLGQPIIIDRIHEGFGIGAFVVEIIAYIERVLGNAVKPWVILCRSSIIAIVVEANHGILAKSMVEYHVYNHHDSTTMGFVNKSLEVIFGAVVFVRSKEKGGIVAPRKISFKLPYRHQFNCINPQLFQVI